MARSTAATENATTEDLQAQIATLKKDISSLTKTFADYGRAQGEQVRNGATEAYDAARVATEKQAADLQKQALAAYGDVENKVRENPSASIGVAAGLGFLVGLVTAARR
ncbi:DUF883 family protein [Celeribacter arenosi]|uniref:DUF883 domain-containing protein n=1 Tax=Celeribacter arenosi TaxID=792649 RepID=A0ABP7JT47_9RHOB